MLVYVKHEIRTEGAPIQLYSHAPTDTFLELKLASSKKVALDTDIIQFRFKLLSTK